MTEQAIPTRLFGWRVVTAAFILAVFGWGAGFYGPPVYLHAVVQRTGWAVTLVSSAVTLHFLVGALIVANLPGLYRRFGLPTVTSLGAVSLGVGVVGWAAASVPWQLFLAALLSGIGRAAMGLRLSMPLSRRGSSGPGRRHLRWPTTARAWAGSCSPRSGSHSSARSVSPLRPLRSGSSWRSRLQRCPLSLSRAHRKSLDRRRTALFDTMRPQLPFHGQCGALPAGFFGGISVS
jgi:hypothetical protein